MVCNAAGYSDQTVAELVIGFAIDALRKIPEADRQVRALQGNAGLMGRELCRKTVGIIGLGKIGLRTAKLFQAFGCRVIAYNHSESEEAKQMGISYLPLEEVLSQSDILSVHLPLNDTTRGFLGESQLKLMKPNAVLINCARGPVVDEAALVKALSENRLGYACVDVFDKEPPLPAEQPLLHAERALLTPHVGYLSEESMVRRAKIVFDNVQSFLDGKPQNVCKI